MKEKNKQDLLTQGADKSTGHIVINFYESGSWHIDRVDNQNFYGSKPAFPYKEKEKTSPEEVFDAEERIRHCIALLMKERIDDEPLFNLQSHWQAVYRILVDKGYCRDSDFDGFDAFVQTVMPDEVNKPYKKDSLKQISQTDFVRPFKEWHYDAETSKTRKPFNRMVAIAMRFTELLEKNGL